jgi:hypothetical protein
VIRYEYYLQLEQQIIVLLTAISDKLSDKSTILITALATIAAAFAGSLSAFALERREKTKRMKADNITAGNRALFTIKRQYERLHNIRSQWIDPVRDHPLRHIIISPCTAIEYADLKFDMSSLTYLLEPQRQKQLQVNLREALSKLFLEEERFQSVVNSANQRSQLHIDKVQPLLAQGGVRLYADALDQMQVGDRTFSLPQDSGRALDAIELILGHALHQTLLQNTMAFIDNIDKSLVSLLQIGDELKTALSELYPKNTNDILSFTPF